MKAHGKRAVKPDGARKVKDPGGSALLCPSCLIVVVVQSLLSQRKGFLVAATPAALEKLLLYEKELGG